MLFALTVFSIVALMGLSFFLVIKGKHENSLKKLTFLFHCLFTVLLLLLLSKQVKLDATKGILAQIKQQFWRSETISSGASTVDDIPPPQVMKKEEIKPLVILDVPIIKQLPELPRGCEVTSLAMLLQHAGLKVDKMILAKQIKRDPTPYQKKHGKVYFGNPNDGFVGDMYTLNKPGLGVYHKPIKELAEQYLPNQIVDLTGSEFTELQKFLSKGMPIWIIINSTYKKLPKSAFREWETPTGRIEITYYEHSVVVTGYDNQYIYFNDPLTGQKNKKAPRAEFLEAWVQMGRQAVTYQSH